MTGKSFPGSKGAGYNSCGLCTGKGPLREDEGLVTLYMHLKGNPQAMQKFLDMSPYAPCAGIQMYVMTKDSDLGLALVDHCLNSAARYIPACDLRNEVFPSRNGDQREVGRIGLKRLRGLIKEAILCDGSAEVSRIPLGTRNPDFADYKQEVLYNAFPDGNEDNPDRLRVQDALVPLEQLELQEDAAVLKGQDSLEGEYKASQFL